MQIESEQQKWGKNDVLGLASSQYSFPRAVGASRQEVGFGAGWTQAGKKGGWPLMTFLSW